METTISIWRLYRDDGKEHGNCHIVYGGFPFSFHLARSLRSMATTPDTETPARILKESGKYCRLMQDFALKKIYC